MVKRVWPDELNHILGLGDQVHLVCWGLLWVYLLFFALLRCLGGHLAVMQTLCVALEHFGIFWWVTDIYFELDSSFPLNETLAILYVSNWSPTFRFVWSAIPLFKKLNPLASVYYAVV